MVNGAHGNICSLFCKPAEQSKRIPRSLSVTDSDIYVVTDSVWRITHLKHKHPAATSFKAKALRSGPCGPRVSAHKLTEYLHSLPCSARQYRCQYYSAERVLSCSLCIPPHVEAWRFAYPLYYSCTACCSAQAPINHIKVINIKQTDFLRNRYACHTLRKGKTRPCG